MKPPKVRPEAYDLYWQFAANRQAVLEARLAGHDQPWTDDPILLEYKFCNVFRATDRVSQYLIRHVAYHAEHCTPADRLFQIIAFRIFSRISTWERLREYLGRYPLIHDLRSGKFLEGLEHAKATEGGLYTGAFILCATDAYSHKSKHLNHNALLRDMFIDHRLADDLLDAASLHKIYDLLHAYPLMGDFMAYQIAIDLNYSDLINFDEDDFTRPGPGALRGIHKCFKSLGDYTPTEIVHYMVDRQEMEFARLGLQFNGLFGRRLHAIDAQGLFCETDKYCRVALPELTSSRRRIKARFAAQTAPVTLFLPPKWGLNPEN